MREVLLALMIASIQVEAAVKVSEANFLLKWSV